jgi:hypothetical protein
MAALCHTLNKVIQVLTKKLSKKEESKLNEIAHFYGENP